MRDLRTPTPDELERYAAVHHVDLSDDEREDLAAAAAGLLDAYERLAALSPSEPTAPADPDRSGSARTTTRTRVTPSSDAARYPAPRTATVSSRGTTSD